MILNVDQWNSVMVQAMDSWTNVQGASFEFTWDISPDAESSCEFSDGMSVVVMTETYCGWPWDALDSDGTTLAVTAVACTDGQCEEGDSAVDADVTFNAKVNWAVYDDEYRPETPDIRRTALHEFGHVAGLNHPDGVGQTRTAIMNGAIGDIDAIQWDDEEGLRAKYP